MDIKKFERFMSDVKKILYECQEGARAFDDGKTLADNPHQIPTRKAADWQLGWLEAKYAKEYWEDQAAEFNKIFDVPFVFWTCTNGCRGRVEWNEECTEAVCLECGMKSTDGSK